MWVLFAIRVSVLFGGERREEEEGERETDQKVGDV